ncbi:translation initiation factor IF-2-like isoform X1 [Pteropus medius]|uniref:translation initiation factor IF-2-like isoform X1 n=1 Tax=Pteropus vampyrus TaxID=132908 RepID=UPI00196B985D|nr:translation initiation factor IF-2-like isoform X1 [Pteropus giganteus]XP_039695543.1 translation initiation factor IF-2-like isoform X1 [Pteropus giganteus]XP_039695544.1 translation initiation factor IF-2-like isoform X1 [Pteropus giganteus]XP_039695545.1 translation initiation factor IF-2-like isoform X1 [Pteropus giganteus]
MTLRPGPSCGGPGQKVVVPSGDRKQLGKNRTQPIAVTDFALTVPRGQSVPTPASWRSTRCASAGWVAKSTACPFPFTPRPSPSSRSRPSRRRLALWRPLLAASRTARPMTAQQRSFLWKTKGAPPMRCPKPGSSPRDGPVAPELGGRGHSVSRAKALCSAGRAFGPRPRGADGHRPAPGALVAGVGAPSPGANLPVLPVHPGRGEGPRDRGRRLQIGIGKGVCTVAADQGGQRAGGAARAALTWSGHKTSGPRSCSPLSRAR